MPLLEGNQTHPEKAEEDHDGNDNTEVSETGGVGNGNNQQGGNTDENKDESKDDKSEKKKQEEHDSRKDKRVQGDGREKIDEKEPLQYPLVGEPPFPIGALEALDEQLNRLRWVVPVLARSDLEQLLRAAIRLCRDGTDDKSEPCQRFFREGLTTSFTKVMLDDAVINWKEDIQRCIFNCAKLLVEICAVKMDQDWFVLHDLLVLVFNPLNKWNVHNYRYEPESCGKDIEEYKIFARPHEAQFPKGWLVDMINLFGEYGGFEKFRDRILKGDGLNVSIIAAMIRPFGLCADFLSPMCVEKYIVPVVDKVLSFLDSLMDEALKKETASEAKSDNFTSVMKSLRHLSRRVPGREDVEAFQLKMIVRLLKISSFSGKMNALNEINKIIPSHHPQIYSYQHQVEDDHITADKLAAWMKEHNVLSIVLQDNLHQPQYVEKLEKILRFCIKEHSLSVEDLDAIWACQDGKHEAIVKNIHDLLARLAWNFSPEQLDHLCGCFQRSWVGAGKKQRDDLLVFIHRLAADDKEGVMAVKVLGLLWNLAHRSDCPTDTMDRALNAHLKILDYSCSQDQRVQWLRSCVDELINNTWVLPALKQMEEIFGLFPVIPPHSANQHHSTHFYYRSDIIGLYDQKFQLLTTVCHNLEQYLQQARGAVQEDPSIPAENLCLDNWFNHLIQVQNRLDFIRFVLRDGQLWLGYAQALLVWQALIDAPAYDSDREACFKWFDRLVSDEPDIEGDTAKKLLIEKVMKLNPSVLSEYGFKCFDRFFRHVNQSDQNIVPWRRGFLTESVNLVHYTFIHKCMEIVRRTQANLLKYTPEELAQEPQEVQDRFRVEATKIIRCLTVLKEYAGECDEEYAEERAFPAHGRAMWGRPFLLIVHCIMGHSRPPEDIEMFSHSNETVAALRRHILQK